MYIALKHYFNLKIISRIDIITLEESKRKMDA